MLQLKFKSTIKEGCMNDQRPYDPYPTQEHITDALKDPDEYVRAEAIKQQNTKSTNESFYSDFITKQQLALRTVGFIADNESFSYRRNLLEGKPGDVDHYTVNPEKRPIHSPDGYYLAPGAAVGPPKQNGHQAVMACGLHEHDGTEYDVGGKNGEKPGHFSVTHYGGKDTPEAAKRREHINRLVASGHLTKLGTVSANPKHARQSVESPDANYD